MDGARGKLRIFNMVFFSQLIHFLFFFFPLPPLRMEIKSKSWNAFLTVDGSSSIAFNDGAVAVLSVHKEDALKTVQLFAPEP